MQGCFPGFSQEIRFLPLTRLNTKELLPGLNTRKMIKDRLGRLWVGTQDGLYRYDGHKGVFYSNGAKDARFSLKGMDIFDLVIEESGDYLWVLSNNGGLSRISINEGIVVSSFVLPGMVWSKSMVIAGNEGYIGTAEGMIIRVNLRTQKVISFLSLAQQYGRGGSVENILIDGRKNIWFMVSGLGVLIADRSLSKKKLIALPDMGGGKDLQFTDAVVDGDRIIVASSGGIRCFSIPGQRYTGLPAMFSRGAISLLSRPLDCLAIHDHILLCAGSHQLTEVDLGSGGCRNIVFSRNKADQDWLLYTSSMVYDGQSIWIGGQYGTAWVKDVNTPFTAYYQSMDSSENLLGHCMTLFHQDPHVMYACTDDGLYRLQLRDGVIRRLSGREMFYSGHMLAGGELLTSGPHGTFLFDKGGRAVDLRRRYPELAAISREPLVMMESLRDSLYFFAAFDPEKVFCWDRVRREIRRLPGSQLGGSNKGYFIKKLYVDSHSRLWILLDGSINIYDPATGKISELPISVPGSSGPWGMNMDMCESAGRFWIAVYGKGIIELSENGQYVDIFSAREGLHNLGLDCVFPIGDSLVVSSSNEGLAVIRTASREVYNYFEEDGLHSNYFEEFSGSRYGDSLFFGGLRGLTVVNMKKFHFDHVISRPYFTSIHLQRTSGAEDIFGADVKQLEVAESVIQASINFSSVNFFAPEKENFSYRIPEVSAKWITLGNQFSLPLIGLAPGTYTVQIRSSNQGPEEQPLQIALVWLPHWYQTWWFKLALIVLAAGLGYLFFLYRISQIRQQQQIRRAIASDLHDDLGGTLNALKVYSHLARREPGKEEHLSHIEESLGQATSGLRDMVWVLDDPDDTLQGIADRLRKFAMPVALAKDIRLDWEVEEESPRVISKKEKQNLFMIGKEAINNAIKYSDCKTIRVSLRQHRHNISLVVQDDGKGFDVSAGPAGNGLKNIRFRAQQIKYTANILSFPGGGTTIEVVRN